MESNETRWSLFVCEVAREGFVWTVEQDGGYATSRNRYGTPCFPWWSSRERVLRQLKTVLAYKGFTQIGFTWEQFLTEFQPWLRSEKVLIGVNYASSKNVGFDLPLDEVVGAVNQAILAKGKTTR